MANWLGKRQAEALLDAPSRDTLKGLRDARWVIVNLVGKRNKTRSVPMPAWAKTRIDAWAEAAGLSEGRIFRAVNKDGAVVGEGMSAQSVYRAVQF